MFRFYAPLYLGLGRLQRAALDARRRDRSWHYLVWSAVHALALSIMLGLVLSLSLVHCTVGVGWIALGFGGLFVVPAFAGAIARTILVPLGAYRAAYSAGVVNRRSQEAAADGLSGSAWAVASPPAATRSALTV